MDRAYWELYYHEPNYNNSDCQEVHNLSWSERCSFVSTAPDCQQDGGLIQYTIFCFCTLGGNLLPLAITILFFFWLLLFVSLAVCADDFFCPSLQVIAKTLRMSDNIAGVTLLAFGNGAPDVFSAIAAVKNAKDGDVGLALGALLGAGIFVTTVVAGAITMVTSFHVMERPFLRDVIFYIGAVCMTFYVLYDHKITLGEAIGFIVLYVVYVIVVIVGRIIYQRHKEWKRIQALSIQSNPDDLENLPRPETDDNLENPAETLPNGTGTFGWRPEYGVMSNGIPNGGSDSEDTPLLEDSLEDEAESRSPLVLFLLALCPIDVEKWRDSRWFVKPYLVYKVIPLFILRLTVPVVDVCERNDNWNRYLNTLHCVISPVMGIFLASSSYALYRLGGVFPVWALLFLVGTVFAVAVFFTSKNNQPPVYHWVFAYIGFLVAVVWIQAIANEIVNLLQTFGVVFNISNAILGLTFLAWGNSIGDMVANVVMSKHGAPRAGISACFGGPLFNLLLGVGIPFTAGCAASGKDYEIQFTLISLVMVVSLLFSLVSSLVCLPLMRFKLNRKYGIYLFVVYAAFLVLALLVETGVIKADLH